MIQQNSNFLSCFLTLIVLIPVFKSTRIVISCVCKNRGEFHLDILVNVQEKESIKSLINKILLFQGYYSQLFCMY